MADLTPALIEKAEAAAVEALGDDAAEGMDLFDHGCIIARAVLDAVAEHHADFCDAQYNVESYREHWLAERARAEQAEAERTVAKRTDHYTADDVVSIENRNGGGWGGARAVANEMNALLARAEQAEAEVEEDRLWRQEADHAERKAVIYLRRAEKAEERVKYYRDSEIPALRDSLQNEIHNHAITKVHRDRAEKRAINLRNALRDALESLNKGFKDDG